MTIFQAMTLFDTMLNGNVDNFFFKGGEVKHEIVS